MIKFFCKYARFTISSTIGFLIFLLKFGYEKLIPSNISWLLNARHDWGQHYLGWSFFRNESWHFPIGKIEGYYYPISTNIGFTDSIPLFSIPLKLISNLLSEDFQFFGIWFLFCFILTAYFSIKILQKYNFSWLNIILISLLITGNPVLLFRVLHPALCSHWLILASIYLYLKKGSSSNIHRILLQQLLLLLVSALVHPYMVLLVVGFSFALITKVTFIDKLIKIKSLFYYLITSFTLLFSIWYLVGYISITNAVSNAVANAYGLYSMNLNAFYNSFGFSSILSNYTLVTPHQYEGYMYLGVGLILFIIFTLLVSIPKIIKKHNYKRFKTTIPLLILCVFYFLFSITNKISLNDNVLFEYKLPSIVLKFGNIFRASSRTFWVNYYLILILFFIVFSKIKIHKSIKSIILIAVVCVQFYDLQTFFKKKEYEPGTYLPSLSLKRWDTILDSAKHLKTFPPYGFINSGVSYEYQDLAYVALKNNLSYTDAYVARTNRNAEIEFSSKMITDLIDKPIEKNEVYVTNEEHLNNFIYQAAKFNSNISYLDGYYVISSKETKPLIQTEEEKLILLNSKKIFNSQSFKLFDEDISESKDIKHHIENISFTSDYMRLKGWAFEKNKNNTVGDSIFVILHNSDYKYVSKLKSVIREDVTTAFKKENLDNSGFKSINFFNGIKKGRYDTYIGIKGENSKWSYINLFKTINVHQSEFITPIKNKEVFFAGTNINYNIESVEQNIEKGLIRGWSFVKKITSKDSEIFIILQNEKESFSLNTMASQRPDVHKHFKEKYNYINTGFNVKFDTSNLPKGKYDIGIHIQNTKLNRKEFIVTKKTIEIE